MEEIQLTAENIQLTVERIKGLFTEVEDLVEGGGTTSYLAYKLGSSIALLNSEIQEIENDLEKINKVLFRRKARSLDEDQGVKTLITTGYSSPFAYNRSDHYRGGEYDWTYAAATKNIDYNSYKSDPRFRAETDTPIKSFPLDSLKKMWPTDKSFDSSLYTLHEEGDYQVLQQEANLCFIFKGGGDKSYSFDDLADIIKSSKHYHFTRPYVPVKVAVGEKIWEDLTKEMSEKDVYTGGAYTALGQVTEEMRLSCGNVYMIIKKLI